MASPLEEVIKDHIRHHGPVDVAWFMRTALSHPKYGYYMSRDPFGSKGDFTTAPEISQLFGEMLAAWVLHFLEQQKSDQTINLVECGPGRGTLMADLLRVIDPFLPLQNKLKVHLVEISPVLKKKQQETLADYKNISWHETLETVPENGALVILANEFLDALPVHQLIKKDQIWYERVISFDDNGFGYGVKAADPALLAFMPQEAELEPESAIYEISTAAMGFVQQLCAKMKKCPASAALLIDYGHTQPGFGETLQALYKHEPCAVLENIGQADITAHIDFSKLVTIAEDNNMSVAGPIEQAEFLMISGIMERAAYLKSKAPDKKTVKEIDSGLERLVSKSQMGAMFKVLGIYDEH